MGFNPFLLPRDGAEVTPLSVLSDGAIRAAQLDAGSTCHLGKLAQRAKGSVLLCLHGLPEAILHWLSQVCVFVWQ